MDSSLDHIPFLRRLAAEIKSNKNEEVIVVLPNRRSLFVLKAMLAEMDFKAELFTVDDLMERLSGYKLIEPEELQVSFYQVYCSLEEQPQDFERFSSWALTFLSDANDLDLYLGNVNLIYDHIKAYHATGAVFNELNAGPLELAYLSFWDRLPKYYEALKNSLESIGLAYRGLMYRKVAQEVVNDATKLNEVFGAKIIYWVGIIPGNPSERVFIDTLKKRNKLFLLADVDQHYLRSSDHEAGRLFSTKSEFSYNGWEVDLLRTSAKKLIECPVAGQMAQLLVAKQAFDKLSQEDRLNTAIVLADSSLLTPFLEVFAAEKDKLNVTAGFPMKATLVHRFVMALLTLHANRIERNGKIFFYHKHVSELLTYRIVEQWLTGALSLSELRSEMVEFNLKFLSQDFLKGKMQSDLFAHEAYELLFEWNLNYNEIFEKVSKVLSQWKTQTESLAISALESHAIGVYIDKLKQLLSQFGEVLQDQNFDKLRKLIQRQIGQTRLFLEQPKNDALQVIGMLETRMIDFKKVWFLGASDDFMPGTSVRPTHIPYLHRKAFALPTSKDTASLAAYHFYRLIQRAEEVRLIYNVNAGPLGSGEPSRFMLQIKEELLPVNSKLTWSVEKEAVQIKTKDLEPLQITKSSEVKEAILRFLARRVSPSAINKFINSPLDFYYFYVLGLKEQDEVEEDIDAAILGSVIHKVLEEIYKPFEGKLLKAEDLKPWLNDVNELLQKQFRLRFSVEDLKIGKNLLMVELAEHYINQFLCFEIADIQKNGAIRILNIELPMTFKTEIHGVALTLFGFADRIDERGGKIRIIDYKSGTVDQSKLRYKKDAWATDSAYSKSVQLALYKYMYCEIRGVEETRVDSLILSFPNIDAGYMPLKNTEVLEDVDFLLKEVVMRMLDAESPLQHLPESKFTNF